MVEKYMEQRGGGFAWLAEHENTATKEVVISVFALVC